MEKQSDDINKAFDMLKDMLSTDQGKETLSSLIGSFSGGGDSHDAPKSERPLYDNVNDSGDQHFGGHSDLMGSLNSIGKYQDVLSSVKSANNAPRMKLMHAIKPYLSKKRIERFDVLLNLMKYSDVPAAIISKIGKR